MAANQGSRDDASSEVGFRRRGSLLAARCGDNEIVTLPYVAKVGLDLAERLEMPDGRKLMLEPIAETNDGPRIRSMVRDAEAAGLIPSPRDLNPDLIVICERPFVQEKWVLAT